MPQQVTRLAVVFGILILALVLARSQLVPKTFGQAGHYRAAAVTEIAAAKIHYAGHEACAACHEDIAKTRSAGRHRNVACEVCHGPAADHVAAPTDVHPSAPKQRGRCPQCHGYDSARPTGFPQIDPVTHNPVRPCISCHQPHAPETPREPEACGACHGSIARTHAVSAHALIGCTRCHETDRRHKTTPLLIRPSKPASRAFCAGCHARDAGSPKEIPRVDVTTHGERYVCWQCHYPHFPEAK
ncbi:MAG: hypothetical protein HY235_19165 [Acidobacteria bacterium]|nr:hypothetical protein [Acidobacteriota bacterium]